MNFVLTNPSGLWALLGIPAVLLIHFLQRKAKVLPIATRFLLEKSQRESASGRRFERLMNSVPLWMQILAVLLLTWLLAEPRWQKAHSVQRIAIVLDASASMEVFQEELAEHLKSALPKLVGFATTAEFSLFESLPNGQRLYVGDSLDELLESVRTYHPKAGMTDPTHALRLARSVVAREGIVLYATDTPRDHLPYDTRLLAVGSPIDNVGFTGVSFERKEGALLWQALVRNYSKHTLTRMWSVALPDGSRTPRQSLTLAPGALVHIQQAYPENATQITVHLDADDFRLDDALPMVAPQAKRLALLTVNPTPSFTQLANRLVDSLDAVDHASDPDTASLLLVCQNPLAPVRQSKHAIFALSDDMRDSPYLKGPLLAESHPLMDGLNWLPLLARKMDSLTPRPSDQVLLWQGTHPLIFLRKTPALENKPSAQHLFFNFDLPRSNASRLPAMAVLLHRFCESLRTSRVAPEQKNLETNQRFDLAAAPRGSELMLRFTPLEGDASTRNHPASALLDLEAPTLPGFLQITQNEATLLHASVHFGDTREADFSKCGRQDSLGEATGTETRRHTHEDPWWRGATLALLAALLVSWYWATRGKNNTQTPRTQT